MLVDVKNPEGKVVKKIELPDAIYSVPMNEHLLYLVIKAYRANQRQGTHATLTKSLVSGSGKKPFKQKGTGMARQGTRQEPHMPGGAVAHGPQPRDYSQKINKKVKTQAIKIVLSDKARAQKLMVVNDFGISQFKTKAVVTMLKNLGATKALLVSDNYNEFLYKSTRNIYGHAVTIASDFNALDLLKHETIVIAESALPKIEQRLLQESKN